MAHKVDSVLLGIILAVSIFFFANTYLAEKQFNDLEGAMSTYFFPRMILLGIMILTASLMAQKIILKTQVKFEVLQYKLVILIMLLFFLYLLLINVLGYFITTLLFVMMSFKLAGKFKWKTIIAVGLGFTIITSFLFIHLLGVNLPQGFLKM